MLKKILLEDLLTPLLGVLIVGLVLLYVSVVYTENKSCEEKGGKMVGTGEYTSWVTYVGDTPIINETEDMKCTKE